jgi:hypothetical protein
VNGLTRLYSTARAVASWSGRSGSFMAAPRKNCHKAKISEEYVQGEGLIRMI